MKDIQLSHEAWKYDPGKPLGRPGGFGQVFSGEDSNGLAVAVKEFHLSANDLAHRELKIAAELQNRDLRHVLPVLDYGQDADSGRYYVVMPLAEGDLGEEIAKRRAMPELDSVAILSSIVASLLEVSDIVHRDLKPGNVLLLSGEWRLADFGIARFHEEATSSLTLKHFLSEPYAAPEQWRGEHATHKTDVYALGCIAIELLTGDQAFPGPDYQDQHLHGAPAAVPTASPLLRSLISMMLRKSPDSRPSIERVGSQLEIIAARGTQMGESNALEAAGAVLAANEVAAEAEAASVFREQASRQQAANDGLGLLQDLFAELWHRIESAAPTAVGDVQHLKLGEGELEWSVTFRLIPEGSFKETGWDVLAGGMIVLTQARGRAEYAGRAASLWYTRWGDALRWIEVSYMATLGGDVPLHNPFALGDLRDADYAASGVVHRYQLAADPRPIDDEDFDAFCSRWMDRLAAASQRKLQPPSILPEP